MKRVTGSLERQIGLFSLFLLGSSAWFGGTASASEAGSGLGAITLDSIEFVDTEFAQALEFFAAKAEEANPDLPPVNFVVIDPEGEIADRAVNLKLRGVPWGTALKYTCDLAGAVIRPERNAILVGKKEAVEKMTLERTKILRGPGSAATEARLASVVFEEVVFDESSLEEVANFLRLMVLAQQEKEGATNPIPLNVLIKENAREPIGSRKISLRLRKIPLGELVHYATGLGECRFRVDARAIAIGEAEDLARPPGGPRRPSGAIFDQLAAKRIDSIDVPAGSTVSEFLEMVRALGGGNGIAMTEDAVTASRLALHGVTTLELIRYFNEISGTAFRLDPNAFLIVDDPAVTEKPRPPSIGIGTTATSGGTAAGLGFDDP